MLDEFDINQSNIGASFKGCLHYIPATTAWCRQYGLLATNICPLCQRNCNQQNAKDDIASV